ncbi:hypothetical protein LQZ19_12480 [Treponema primitia]|uniref:hypothetical protein n=1 Tax=Treponema primitia TaxID=88058 RepID=UPI00397FFB6E
MKRILIITGLLGVLVFSGCVGTTALGILDETIPEESLCPLEIRNNLAVIIYDNMPVEWVPTITANKTTISLPPGKHSFILRYYTGSSSVNVATKSTNTTVTLEQEFLPGHSYRIYESSIWLIFFTITDLKIKDVTPKNRL